MTVQIIVHSTSGHTLSVVERIQTQLTSSGDKVIINRILASNDKEVDPSKINLIDKPTLDEVDYYILAAPVRGFMLSPVMAHFLEGCGQFNDKPVFILMTQFFPFAFMGGHHALKQFNKHVVAKHGRLVDSGLVNWSWRKKRLRQIEDIVDRAAIKK